MTDAKRGFVSLLGLLLTLGMICLLALIVFKSYFQAPLLDEGINDSSLGPVIDSSSYQSILSSSRNIVEGMNKQLHKREKELQRAF